MVNKEIKEYLSKNGVKGGKARWAKLNKKQKSELGRRMGLASAKSRKRKKKEHVDKSV